MAFNKRTWKGRQGTGLNKFSINGATPVTVINQPDSVTEQGDALSAGNLNDLEDRIYDAFDDIADGTQIVGKATADASGNVITTTYETKADASDLKDAIQGNTARIENLEQEHGGYYDVDVKSPYTVPSGKAKNWAVNVLRGVSRVENQYIIPQLFLTSYSESGITIVGNSDGSYTISGTATADSTFSIHTIYVTANHFFLISLCHPAISGLRLKEVNIGASITDTTIIQRLYGYLGLRLEIDNGTVIPSGTKIFPILTDLNQYFSSDSSVVVSNLTVTDIQQKYPQLLIPRAHDAGSIVDTTYSAVWSRGVNLWDQQWEYGGINSSNGGETTSSTTARSTAYIPVKPLTTYYLLSAQRMYYRFYDINKNYLGASSGTEGTSSSSGYNVAIDIPKNAFYFRFVCDTAIADKSIQICSNSYADKTNFHEYMTDTLTLPEPVTLRSAGGVADELDVENGVITRKTIVKNFADFQWTHVNSGTYGYWISYSHTDILSPVDTSTKAKALCDKYDIISLSSLSGTTSVNCLAVDTSGNVFVNNGSTTNSPTGNGLFVRSTTTTEQLDPIQNPYIATEAEGTISSILTTPVDDNMNLGYLNL